MATEEKIEVKKEAVKSSLELAQEKYDEQEEIIQAELKAKCDVILSGFDKVYAEISGLAEYYFQKCFDIDAYWRPDVYYSIFMSEETEMKEVTNKETGEVTLVPDTKVVDKDPDLKMIISTTKAFMQGVTQALISILKKALVSMGTDKNVLRLIMTAVPKFCVLCGVAAGYEIANLMLIFKAALKMINYVYLEKVKLKFLIKGDDPPTKKAISAAKDVFFNNFPKVKEAIKKHIEETADIGPEMTETKAQSEQITQDFINATTANVSASISSAQANGGTNISSNIDDIIEDAKRNKIAYDSNQLTVTRNAVDAKLNALSGSFPCIKQEIVNMMSSVVYVFNDFATKEVGGFISTYFEVEEGIKKSMQFSTSSIASAFSETKGGSNDVLEQIIGKTVGTGDTLEVEDINKMMETLYSTSGEIDGLDSDSLADIKATYDEQQEKLKEQEEEQEAAAKKTESSGGSEAENVPTISANPGTAGAAAAAAGAAASVIETKITITTGKDPLLESKIEKLGKKVTSDLNTIPAKFEAFTLEAEEQILQVVEDALNMFKQHLIYEPIKNLVGRSFINALLSMKLLNGHLRTLLEKYCKTYKKFGELIKGFTKRIITVYTMVASNMTGLSAFKRILEQLGIPVPDFEISFFQSLLLQLKNILNGIVDIAALIAQITITLINIIVTMVTSLPQEIAKLVTKIVKMVADTLNEIVEYVASVLFAVLFLAIPSISADDSMDTIKSFSLPNPSTLIGKPPLKTVKTLIEKMLAAQKQCKSIISSKTSFITKFAGGSESTNKEELLQAYNLICKNISNSEWRSSYKKSLKSTIKAAKKGLAGEAATYRIQTMAETKLEMFNIINKAVNG